ncbi:lysozyme [Saccharothrix longispora]|uniref:Lysozyme n=2 Tax=Saccharothrix longispora TaxID=33920 RepID=A0ABU1PXG5_9PSEU|nr:lysozyme [Saccharothrix longispora]MDR6595343.1 lysozyme [Saccharothrix longispora]
MQRHRWVTALVLLCLTAVGLTGQPAGADRAGADRAGPGHAGVVDRQQAPRPAARQAGEGEDHAAGSQIALHEGVMAGVTALTTTGPTVAGMDVSSHQGDVDWDHWWAQGKRFAYVKATEGTGYRNPYYDQQFHGSHRVGMLRGAYHFALPDRSDGVTQANYFVDHGGGWTADGTTLPGALDIEYNPYGDDTCYGLAPDAMVTWIRQFTDTYRARTGRAPMIYTSTLWWDRCTGRAGDFSAGPVWVARYADSVGPLPHPWTAHAIWQHSSTPIDQNLFNGTPDDLLALARG